MHLSVVIPVFNEERTVLEIIERVRHVDLGRDVSVELVVVDDGSTDATPTLLAPLASRGLLRLIRQPRNQGKGAALRAGFRVAAGDIIIIQDADLEYDPADYYAMTAPIVNGQADVVFGARFDKGGARPVHSFWHSMGNRALTLLSNAVTGLNLSDMEVGYKAFRREVIETIDVECDRFGIEPELTAKVAAGRWRVYEVPISYRGRSYADGKKIGWRDGVDALRQIVRFGISIRLRDPVPRRRPPTPPLPRTGDGIQPIARLHQPLQEAASRAQGAEGA
jgi:glycosyltransferase involved in cell wall biosynthesis